MEAEKLHPKAAALMEEWRKGRLEIADLLIPGAEDFHHFYRRGQDFLRETLGWGSTGLVVGTRSIMILLASILLGRTPAPGGGYREIPINNSSFLTFIRTTSTQWVLDHALSGCPEAGLE
jgi:hypothetical protein